MATEVDCGGASRPVWLVKVHLLSLVFCIDNVYQLGQLFSSVVAKFLGRLWKQWDET